MSDTLHVVTGPFGYSGRRIAHRLLDAGIAVRGLTNSPRRGHDLAARIDVRPLSFDQPEQLTESLRGATVLYNTYWIRFNYGRRAARSNTPGPVACPRGTPRGHAHAEYRESMPPISYSPPQPSATAGQSRSAPDGFTRAEAVANSLTLFAAARAAGVRRIVHVSIANPSEDSPFEYYSGKARLERAIRESGLSYAILRPAVLFGDEDILINNIAWMLRKFPIFGVFGDGRYGIRPIHVDDFAALAVRCAGESDNAVFDAVGPERFEYRELLRRIAEIIGIRRRFISVPPLIGYGIGRAVGWFVRDVILTRDEIGALMAGLLDTDGPSTGETRLTDWANVHADTLGRRYASELARRRDRGRSYEQLMR